MVDLLFVGFGLLGFCCRACLVVFFRICCTVGVCVYDCDFC